MIRVADYIIKRIAEEGVKHLFYVPGGQCVYLMDAVRRAEEANEITSISTHHEQAAAYAAIAYSQHTKNLGACLVTTGCAGTNTMTGLLHAWQDSIPCIFISGQQAPEQTTHEYFKKTGVRLRQIGVQEADIVQLVQPITKSAVMLTDPADVAYEVDRAIYMAKEGRQGPTWIDVPLPVQNSMVDEDGLRRYDKYIEYANAFKAYHDAEDKSVLSQNMGNDSIKPDRIEASSTLVQALGKPLVSDGDIEYVIDALKKAERPVIFAGHGVQSAHAEEELRRFVEWTHIPVLFTRFSVDMLECDHPYNMGVVCSVSANRHANFIIQNSDLVIAIGNRLSIDTTGPEQGQFAREAQIIVVDIDETEHQKEGVSIDKFIKADAKDFLRKALAVVEKDISSIGSGQDAWIDRCNHWKNVLSGYEYENKTSDIIVFKQFLKKLTEHLPEKSTVLADAGFTGAIISSNVHMKKGDRLIHAYAQGEMGFVMPGACGAACADPEGTIVSITGDGSAMMNLQELQTFVRNDFNIKLIINSNYGYSGVRHGQKAHFRGKSKGTDPSNGLDFPDFGKLSEAFGIRYIKIDKPIEIDEKLDVLFCDNKPAICEVNTDPDEFDLHNALVMYGKRKFGFRPIEDQSPFIDRDVFFEEMIVEPLEESSGKPM